MSKVPMYRWCHEMLGRQVGQLEDLSGEKRLEVWLRAGIVVPHDEQGTADDGEAAPVEGAGE